MAFSFIRRALGLDKVFASAERDRLRRQGRISVDSISRIVTPPITQPPPQPQVLPPPKGLLQQALPPAGQTLQDIRQGQVQRQALPPAARTAAAIGRPLPVFPPQQSAPKEAPAVQRGNEVRRSLQRARLRGQRLKAMRRVSLARKNALDRARRNALGLQTQDNRLRLGAKRGL